MSGWDDDEPQLLFDAAGRSKYQGPTRRGLDLRIRELRAEDVELPADQVANLRALADSIDGLRRQLRSPATRPFDHDPMGRLVKQYDETATRVFAAAGDGGNNAFEAFLAGLTPSAEPAAAAGDSPPA